MSLIKFKIPPRSRKCYHCENKFEDGKKIHSTIHGEEENPSRRDYCQDCFNENLINDSTWGHWYIVLKKQTQKLSFDQRAMEVFKEALDGDDAQYLIFIAQYLKRKKQLIQRPEIKKEESLFFEDPKTSEVYGLQKIDISQGNLEHYKHQFLSQLEPSKQ